MRVLVTGGRDYTDWPALVRVLNGLGITELCHGAARGADKMAGSWARIAHIPVTAYPADWDGNGKAAGPIRNRLMLDDFKPDLVVAFPGGKGTAHMVSIARKAGLPIQEVTREEP